MKMNQRKCGVQTGKLDGWEYHLAGDFQAKTLFIQFMDKAELDCLREEVRLVCALTSKTSENSDVSGNAQPFLMAGVGVTDWNAQLSPWYAPAVRGTQVFSGHAQDTLDFLEQSLIPGLMSQFPALASGIIEKRNENGSNGAKSNGMKSNGTIGIGGYSLAGLFALWASCKSSSFQGTAAVSPSVWFPGWLPFLAEHPVRSGCVYLSLGRKEEKAGNPVMAQVGDALRETKEMLDQRSDQKVSSILEWNPGNHFFEPRRRMAKGFAWLLEAFSNTF